MNIDRTLLACIELSVSNDNRISFPPNEDSSRKSFFTFRQLLAALKIINEAPDILDWDTETTPYCEEDTVVCSYSVDWEHYSEWNSELDISTIVFKQRVTGWEHLKDVKITGFDCKFCDEVDFKGIRASLYQPTLGYLAPSLFPRYVFTQAINFSNAEFYKKLSLHKIQFQREVDFSGASFQDVDFADTLFEAPVDFTRAIFHCTGDFNKVQFFKEITFVNTEFNSPLIFENILLYPNSYIFFKKDIGTPASEISITNTIINGRLEFIGNNSKTLNLRGSTIPGTLSRVNFTPEPANWETAVILKHEEIKHNNVIEALRYKAKEKELYYKELRDKSKKSFQEWGELLSLWLSWLSNNHGQSWLRAFAFTLITPSIFFVIFYAPVASACWGKFASQYFAESRWVGELIRYYIPTNYDLLIAYTSSPNISGCLKIVGGLIYFFGKIFAVYGGVELVQAFRKYNKNPS